MFNETVSKSNQKTVRNADGYKVWKLPIDQELFRYMLSFKPRNSMYQNIPEKLQRLEELIDANDSEFVLALSYFMGREIGLRLSPTIATTRIAQWNSSIDDIRSVHAVVRHVFTRPDFLANAIMYAHHMNPVHFNKWKTGWAKQIISSSFANSLAIQLSNFAKHTLINQKMLRRNIKLKNLIIGLQPTPNNPVMSQLYKSIIEDHKSSKLSVNVKNDGSIESDHVRAVLSSTNITDSQKQQYVDDNIETIPLNALIRNLSKVQSHDIERLEKRLNSVFADGNASRFINPFDLIMMEGDFSRYNYNLTVNDELTNVLDRILEKHIEFPFDVKKPLILFDVSGSMTMNDWPLRDACKFMALLKNSLHYDFKFYGFGNSLHDLTDQVRQLKSYGANKFAQKLFRLCSQFNEGTAVLRCTTNALMKHPDADCLIIITDEQSNDERKEIQAYRNIMTNSNINGRAVIVNVNPIEGTIIKPSADISRIQGIDGKVLMLIKALFGWQSFKNVVLNEFQKVR